MSVFMFYYDKQSVLIMIKHFIFLSQAGKRHSERQWRLWSGERSKPARNDDWRFNRFCLRKYLQESNQMTGDYGQFRRNFMLISSSLHSLSTFHFYPTFYFSSKFLCVHHAEWRWRFEFSSSHFSTERVNRPSVHRYLANTHNAQWSFLNSSTLQ